MTRRTLAILAALLLLAVPAVAQAPVPPEGTPVIIVGLSDGMTVLPVSGGNLPLRCEVVGP